MDYIFQHFLLLTVSIVVDNTLTVYITTIRPIFGLRRPNYSTELDEKPMESAENNF